MNASTLLRRLRAAGARAELRDGELLVDGRLAVIEFKQNRLPEQAAIARSLSKLASRPGMEPLLVIAAPRASKTSISWVLEHPEHVTLVLDNLVVHRGQVTRLAEAEVAWTPKRGPKPYARHAVGRALLSGAPRNDQAHLAKIAGVTQGSVSNALRAIDPDVSADELFDTLVATYPGPGGQIYYWWSDRPVREQVKLFWSDGVLVSGDFAADVYAPWRVSEHTVAYMSSPMDLARDGFVLATEDDFTTMLVVPQDPTITATAAGWGTSLVVDPVIAAFDVQRTATTGDGGEAVAKLREFVVRHYETREDG